MNKRQFNRNQYKKRLAKVKREHVGEFWNPKNNKWEMKTPPIVKNEQGSLMIAGTRYSRKRQHYPR